MSESKNHPVLRHRHLLGVKTDAQIARIAGVSQSYVTQTRNMLGIGRAQTSLTVDLTHALSANSKRALDMLRRPAESRSECAARLLDRILQSELV